MEYLEIAAAAFTYLLILLAMLGGLILAFTFAVSHSMVRNRGRGEQDL